MDEQTLNLAKLYLQGYYGYMQELLEAIDTIAFLNMDERLLKYLKEKATNSKGESLKITRPNPYQWNVSKHDETVNVTYTLIANRCGGMTRNIGTISHEFFHAWNVERIRPQSLEPFSFEEANMSGEM